MGSSNSQATPGIAAATSIKVKAAPGLRVPMEGSPRKYITDAEDVPVMRTAYYIRRLKDGDLIRTDLPVVADVKQASTTAAVAVQTRGVASEA